MEDAKILSLLALAVTASGCIGPGGGGGEAHGTVTINSFQVEPSTVYSGGTVQVSLELENTGSVPAELKTGERGSRILKDYCPYLFENKRYSAVPSFVQDSSSVELPPGREVSMSWRLEQKGNVPLIGASCEIDAQVPFGYSAESYRQIQIKSSPEVEGSGSLDYSTSSGPLRVEIAPSGGSGQEGEGTYVKPDSGRTEFATVWLRLKNPSSGGRTGVVEINESSLEVESELLGINETFKKYGSCGQLAESSGGERECITDDNYLWQSRNGGDPKCELRRKTPLRIQNGHSRAFKCEVNLSEIDLGGRPLRTAGITASIQYEYLKDAGTRTVEVKHGG